MGQEHTRPLSVAGAVITGMGNFEEEALLAVMWAVYLCHAWGGEDALGATFGVSLPRFVLSRGRLPTLPARPWAVGAH